MSQQHVKPQSSRGDLTGRRKEQDAKKNAKEQAEAQQRMAIANAQEKQAKKNEIVDYTQPKPVVEKGPEVEEQDGTPQQIDETDSDEVINRVVSEAGPQPVVTADEVQVAEKPKALIRALYDIPAVTIGYGTEYEFEGGRKYKVPPHVAHHLSERGLVEKLF